MPYDENLALTSSTGPVGLGKSSLGTMNVQPLAPAHRNQYNAGLEQQFGSKFNIQAECFWKYTHDAYDFNTILDTPLNFPIQFRESKIDGATVYATPNKFHGLSGGGFFGRRVNCERVPLLPAGAVARCWTIHERFRTCSCGRASRLARFKKLSAPLQKWLGA